jgi:hypothetical protein
VSRKFGDSREPQRRKSSRSRTPLSKKLIGECIMYVYFFLDYTYCFVYMCSIIHVECNIISSLAITSRLMFQCLNLQHIQVMCAFVRLPDT